MTPGFEFCLWLALWLSARNFSKAPFPHPWPGVNNTVHVTGFWVGLNKNNYKYEDGAWHITGVKEILASIIVIIIPCLVFNLCSSFKLSALKAWVPPLKMNKNWSVLAAQGQFFLAPMHLNYNHSFWSSEAGICLASIRMKHLRDRTDYHIHVQRTRCHRLEEAKLIFHVLPL